MCAANHPGVLIGTAGVRPGKANRRSGRISRQVPIVLIGNDVKGTAFCEETHTAVLSLHGAGVISPLVAEQELVLRILGTNREAEIRFVGEIAEKGYLLTYGVAFLNEKLDFWGVEFPPSPGGKERPEILTLQCGGCKKWKK